MREHVLSKPPRTSPAHPPCDRCGNLLWPDITVQGRPPLWVCSACRTPRARFWHRHDGQRCPFGYPWPLGRDPAGRLFICC